MLDPGGDSREFSWTIPNGFGGEEMVGFAGIGQVIAPLLLGALYSEDLTQVLSITHFSKPRIVMSAVALRVLKVFLYFREKDGVGYQISEGWLQLPM